MAGREDLSSSANKPTWIIISQPVGVAGWYVDGWWWCFWMDGGGRRLRRKDQQMLLIATLTCWPNIIINWFNQFPRFPQPHSQTSRRVPNYTSWVGGTLSTVRPSALWKYNYEFCGSAMTDCAALCRRIVRGCIMPFYVGHNGRWINSRGSGWPMAAMREPIQSLNILLTMWWFRVGRVFAGDQIPVEVLLQSMKLGFQAFHQWLVGGWQVHRRRWRQHFLARRNI